MNGGKCKIAENNMYYTVIKGEGVLAEDIRFNTYGIAAMASGILLDVVRDYDTDETFVSKVAARLNAGRAQLCHFKDILEDELTARNC